jgi:pimeloyl-ACP methyl ester carboxylesterase
MRVPPVEKVYRSRFVEVDGMRTHLLEAGEGPTTVVLLHSGEFGGCAELSWEYLIPYLARHFRVIAPDWLGFGQTAKVHDFVNKRGRMMSHLARFVQVMALDRAHFVGNSMGATFLLALAAETPCRLPIDRLVAISGGGFVPDNEHRQSLLAYDGTKQAMVALLQAIFENPVWYCDDDYIERRRHLSLMPGAWEAVAAARFKSPVAEPRSEFGQPDTTPYAHIAAPTLLIAGALDRLRIEGYATLVAKQLRDGQAVVLPECGHCPNIEHPELVSKHLLEFLGSGQKDRASQTNSKPRSEASAAG